MEVCLSPCKIAQFPTFARKSALLWAARRKCWVSYVRLNRRRVNEKAKVVEIAVAVLLGAIIGVAGFIPTFKMAGRARKMLVTNNVGSLGLLLLSFALSFIVMLVAVIICAKVARDVLLPFVLALVLGLSITAIVYGIRLNKK